jgi:hypothetical protein
VGVLSRAGVARAEVSKRCWGGREWQGCNSLAAAQTS